MTKERKRGPCMSLKYMLGEMEEKLVTKYFSKKKKCGVKYG